jgi:hypothetical protein
VFNSIYSQAAFALLAGKSKTGLGSQRVYNTVLHEEATLVSAEMNERFAQ